MVAARLFFKTVSSTNPRALRGGVAMPWAVQSTRGSGSHSISAGMLCLLQGGLQRGEAELRAFGNTVALTGCSFWEPMVQKSMNHPSMASLCKRRPRHHLKTLDLRGLAIARLLGLLLLN